MTNLVRGSSRKALKENDLLEDADELFKKRRKGFLS